jgi:mono/diheme cytochrome c family protein
VGQHSDGARSLGIALLGTGFVLASPALAEGRSGAEIFQSKCINCHKGGGNTVVGATQWTLQSDALQKYSYNDVDAVRVSP